jgi:hypothetical protein
MNTKKQKAIISRLLVIVPFCLLAVVGIYMYYEREKLNVDDSSDTLRVEEVAEEKPAPVKQNPQKPPFRIEPDTDLGEDGLPEERPEEGSEEAAIDMAVDTTAVADEAVSVEKKVLSTIYIPQTKSLFSDSNVSIDTFLSRVLQSDHPVSGKVYYRGENGLIESVLTVDESGVVREVLVSYDAGGQPVDRLEIGMLAPNSFAKKYAVLSVYKLSVFEQTAEKTSNTRQERVTEYTITPQLYLKKGKIFTKLL